MMNLTINFNETNVKDMTAFGTLVSQLATMGISYTISNDTIVDTTDVSTKVATKKAYTDATDVIVEFNSHDNAVWFNTTTCANKVIKRFLKDNGFTWDETYPKTEKYIKDYTDKNGVMHKAGTPKLGAWTLKKGNNRDIKGVQKFLAEHPTYTVTAEEITAEREKIATRIAKKNK